MPYIKSVTPQKDSTAPGVVDLYSSPNVYINNVPVALYQNAAGSEAAVFGQISGADYAVDSLTIELDGEENPRVVEQLQRQLIQQGVITRSQLNLANAIVPGSVDVAAAPTTTATITTSTVNLAETNFPDSYVLSDNYTLGQMTKQPDVIFGYQVQDSAGLDVAEVVENLQLLTVNCVELIKAQYSNMFVTNSFRTASATSTSQHRLGMACDMQFTDVEKSDYFAIAQWIRDNVPFDQLLLEYKTTGSGLPWIHISYNKAGNRRQVKTFLNDKVYHRSGLVDLSSI